MKIFPLTPSGLRQAIKYLERTQKLKRLKKWKVEVRSRVSEVG